MQEMYDEDVNAPFELRQSHTIGKLSVESDGLIELVDDQRGRRRTGEKSILVGLVKCSKQHTQWKQIKQIRILFVQSLQVYESMIYDPMLLID